MRDRAVEAIEVLEREPDDPRHGWTWDHCRQDALALLGSEDAVRKYVEGVDEQKEPEESVVEEKNVAAQ